VAGAGLGAAANGKVDNDPEPFRFALHSYGDFSRSQEDIHIEWSATGGHLCLWWNQGSLARRVPSHWIVLGTNGVVVSSWTNSPSNAGEILADFPDLLPWFKWRQHLTNATACAVNDKESKLFSSSVPTRGLLSSTRVEAIQLESADPPIWVKEFKSLGSVDLIGFASEQTRQELFVGFSGTDARMLDPVNGEVTASLTYGHIETDEEALKRKRRFGLAIPGTDVSLKFSSGVLALDGIHRRIAAGSFFDRRVRVVSLVPPFPLLFEANADENPAVPPGGTWRVYWGDFVASGRFLVVEYFFSAPRTGVALRPTEIFETEHWNKVWQVESLQVHSVTVSPDGRAMALIRDNTLEIRPFFSSKIASDGVPHKR